MRSDELVIPKTWRSELARLILFFVFSILCVVLSKMYPGTVITGRLITIGDTTVLLSLPLLWFAPALVLGSAIMRIYNVRYSIDERGIEARVGVISFNQNITRIRFEDIRSIETDQNLVQRLLNIGMVEMGTAATGAMELVFDGVASPTAIQEMIQSERDARIRKARESEKLTADDPRIIGNE